jgi:hypothetical protein
MHEAAWQVKAHCHKPVSLTTQDNSLEDPLPDPLIACILNKILSPNKGMSFGGLLSNSDSIGPYDDQCPATRWAPVLLWTAHWEVAFNKSKQLQTYHIHPRNNSFSNGESYDPLLINGSHPQKNRTQIMELEYSNKSNTSVGGVHSVSWLRV